MQTTTKPKGLARIWREIKRPFQRKPDPPVELLSDWILTEWLFQDDNSSIRKLAQMFYCHEKFQRMASPEATLAIISFFLDKKDYGKAENLLDFHLKKCGEAQIEQFLQVSDFAQKHFKVNERIKISANVFRMLRDAECRTDVLSELKGKNIAIVGNAPTQIGMETGKEIDKHDIVIRFNDYRIAENYSVDYGVKTSIWGANSPLFSHENFGMCQFPVIFVTGTNVQMQHQWTEALDHFLKNTRFFVIPNYVIESLRRESRITDPSSGLRVLYWLKNFVKIEKEKLGIYGFTFNAGQDNFDFKKNEQHHYFDDGMQCIWHCFSQESLFLRELFRENTTH